MMQFTIGSRKGGHRSQARGSSSASPSPAFSSTSPTIIITVITIVFIPPSCSCLCKGHTLFVFFLSSTAPILHPSSSFSSPLSSFTQVGRPTTDYLWIDISLSLLIICFSQSGQQRKKCYATLLHWPSWLRSSPTSTSSPPPPSPSCLHNQDQFEIIISTRCRTPWFCSSAALGSGFSDVTAHMSSTIRRLHIQEKTLLSQFQNKLVLVTL